MFKKFFVFLFVLIFWEILSSGAFAASTTVIPKPKPRQTPVRRVTPEQRQERPEDFDTRFRELLEQYPNILPESANSSDIKWVTPTRKGARADVAKSMGRDPSEIDYPDEDDYIDVGDEDEITPQELLAIQKAQYWMDVKEDLELRVIDKKALELVKEFAKAEHAVHPVHGQNGAITYVYGTAIPKVVCRPNRVTDIGLQPGEKVTGVHAGDTVRWQISPAKSGAGDAEIIHVIIKPLMPDISTNLLVMTDRRTYNLNLVSSQAEYIPSLRFSYPQDTIESWNAFIAANQRKPKETTLDPQYAMSAEDLYFGYKIVDKKKVPWKPVRVFDDGVKTYIQMPRKLRSLEAPVVLFYEGKRQKLVNYRVKGTLYIVDRVMSKKAVMIAGQSQVVIVRDKE